MIVISDSTPLISLMKAVRLEILESLERLKKSGRHIGEDILNYAVSRIKTE